MCRALTEMLADERQEGFEEGSTQCMEFFVLEYLEDGISPEHIVEKLMRGFAMTRKQAEETVERYRKLQ